MKVYYDKDCDLSIIQGKKVAIIGYGSQGTPRRATSRTPVWTLPSVCVKVRPPLPRQKPTA